MNTFSYGQARNYAAQYGVWVGAMWIASFFCYMGGLTRPLLANMGLLVVLLSLLFMGLLLRSFRRRVAPLKFFRAWWMAWLTFLYASLITAIAQYLYFRYLDGGRLLNTYVALFKQPESRQMLAAMMPGQDTDALIQQTLNLLGSLSPIEITIELMMYNIFLGLLLALPVALIGITGRTADPDTK